MMVGDLKKINHKQNQAGDAAVDGLFNGLQAGLAMALYLVLAGLFSGEQPGRTLEWFVFADGRSLVSMAVLHLGVSGIYGVLFGVGLWAAVYRRGAASAAPGVFLAGLLYGILLLGLAWWLILPLGSTPFPKVPFLHLLAAYLLFGAVLGLFSNRKEARQEHHSGRVG